MARPFSKPATTYQQQLELLRSRGMLISDEQRAEFYLRHLNYYRLGAYWLPFEADHSLHQFRPGTRFEDVLNLYVFDRELRLLVMDAIERFEVSVRSQWAYQLAHLHGPHAHLDPSLARHFARWEKSKQQLREAVDHSEEIFIRHLKATYSEDLPPIWAICEVMSLGLLSHWYSNLKPKPTRRAIAAVYGLDETVLASWLHHLTTVRNVCAHHSRLWNREFTVTPTLPQTKPPGLHHQLNLGSRKLYNSLVFLLHCLDVLAPQHHWRSRLLNLLTSHSIPVAAMGFPTGWQAFPIWQTK